MSYFRKLFANTNSSAAIIFALAFCFQLCFFLLCYLKSPDYLYAYDSFAYIQLAENLVNHQVFSISRDSEFLFPEYNRTYCYPAFLAIFVLLKSPIFIVSLVQITLSALTVCLLYLLAKFILNSQKTAMIISLLFAFDIPTAFEAPRVLSESLFAFLIMTFVISFLKYNRNHKNSWLNWSLISLALAILAKPAALFLTVFLGLISIYFSIKKRIKSFIPLLFLLPILAALPQSLANYATTNSFFYSNILPINLLFYNTGMVESKIQNRSHDEWMQNERKELENYFDLRNPSDIAPFNAYAKSKFWESLIAEPWAHTKFIFRNITYFFAHPAYTELKPIFPEFMNRFYLVWQLIINATATIFLIFGLWRWRELNYNKVFILSIILFFALSACFTLATYRFRIPAAAFIYMFGFGTLHTLLKNRFEQIKKTTG